MSSVNETVEHRREEIVVGLFDSTGIELFLAIQRQWVCPRDYMRDKLRPLKGKGREGSARLPKDEQQLIDFAFTTEQWFSKRHLSEDTAKAPDI